MDKPSFAKSPEPHIDPGDGMKPRKLLYLSAVQYAEQRKTSENLSVPRLDDEPITPTLQETPFQPVSAARQSLLL